MILRKARTAVRLLKRLARRSDEHASARLSEFKSKVMRQLWESAAKQLGLSFVKTGPMFTITDCASRRFRVLGHLIETERNLGARVCGNKALTNQLLKAVGANVPEGRSFHVTSAAAAVEYALSMRRPVVLKPASNTSFGQGVSVYLTTEREIRKAFSEAAMLCDEVLVEEFVSGDNYRCLVYEGRCLSILKRELPAVTGDGKHTIKQLVNKENASRLQGYEWKPGQSLLMPIPATAEAEAVLRDQGFSWSTVPASGRRVILGRVCNYQFGASYVEMIDAVHPSLIAAVESAVAEVDISLAGVDVISPDPALGAYTINEVNTCPLLSIHYAPTPHIDVIRLILERYFCQPASSISAADAVSAGR